VNIAVIGCGSIGRRHLANLLRLGVDKRQIVVCDIDEHAADRTMREFEVTSCHPMFSTSPGLPLLSRECQAALICTPLAERSYVLPLLEAGVAVFIEKPATTNPCELERWIRAAKAPTQVGYQLRWHHRVQQFGMSVQHPIKHARFEYFGATELWGGRVIGPVQWECSHEVDLCGWLFHHPELQWSHIDESYAKYELGSVSVVTEYNLKNCDKLLGQARGALAVDAQSGFHFYQFDERDRTVLMDRAYVDELRHFLDCVRYGRQTGLPLEEVRYVTRVVSEAEQAA
jgi:predicted dehydrogenase